MVKAESTMQLNTYEAKTHLSNLADRAAKAIALIHAVDAVYFSSASILEIGLKWKRGIIARKPRQLFQSPVENGLIELPVDVDAIILSCELQHAHSDPFDRLLYAQAKLNKLRLLTVDSTLKKFGTLVLSP